MAHFKDTEELDPQILKIYKEMSGHYADKYVESILTPQLNRATGKTVAGLGEWVEILDDAGPALRAFLGNYAFSRRGKDRDILSRSGLKALETVLETDSLDTILNSNSGHVLWDAFLDQCKKREIKPNESQNRGVIQGILELAQEIYQIDKQGSISAWVADCIEKTGNLEPQFNRIVDIRGVGPKGTSTYLRDLVLIYDLERRVSPVDRIHIHPVDRWTRLGAKYCVPEPQDEKMADWIVAGKINRYARKAGVSGIRFNLGLTYFGQRVVKDPSQFDSEIKRLLAQTH